MSNDTAEHNFHRKNDYEKQGIYRDGLLTKNVDLMIEPIAMYKVITNPDGSLALQGFLSVDGLYHADGIANIMFTWNWENDGWALKHVSAEKKGIVSPSKN
jgi:hypothetical protein